MKMIVDSYEFKTMRNEEIEMEERTEETEQLEEPSIENMFERTLAKLKPKISESEEYKMLSNFLSQLSKNNL